MRLNEREQYLLRVLGRRRYLDAGMIENLVYWDRAERTCRWHLEQLTTQGLLARATFEPLVGGSLEGSRAYVYWLTGQAARMVQKTFGEDVSLPHGRKRGEAYDPTVEHILAANTLYVAFVAAWRGGGDLVRVDWRDEWGGAMLKIPLGAAEVKKRGSRNLHFRPDAFVGLTMVTRGELSPVAIEYAPLASSKRWAAVQNWMEMFPDFSQPRTEGVEKVSLQMAFVESDMGKASREQLQGKLEKYRFVRLRPDRWVQHYGVPLIGPEKKPLMWPGLLVLSQTERRMRTLAEVFTHPKTGYEGWVLLACFDWDVMEAVSTGGKDMMGLVRGPVWYDPRGGREHLTFMDALRGLGKGVAST